MSALRILLSPPDVGPLEQEYVVSAMRSGWVAPAGPDLEAFEHEVAERCQVPFAVALSSGTAALHLALVSWGVGPGDVVVAPTMTFAATANAIRYVGAEPYFVDCDPVTANLDPDLLDEALSDLGRAGRRVAAVIPVDMLGKCCDYRAIEQVATRHGVRLLSDACEALGAAGDGRPAGSMADAAALSFNGNKILTTSGGGMLLTHDEELAAQVRYLSTQARQPVLHYEHTDVGYNYRLSNILAALGRAQLSRFDAMLQRRREWREGYRRLVEPIPGVSILGGEDDDEDNCWLTAITIDEDLVGVSAQQVCTLLNLGGVECRPIWKPLHLQPVFAGCGRLTNGSAERLFEQVVTLPSGSGMSSEDFAEVEERLFAALCGGSVSRTRRETPVVPRQPTVRKEEWQGLYT
jgi:dTDP-4-amino-4,6-dideoxygalactose transaminase